MARDSQIGRAKRALKKHFVNANGRPIRMPYHQQRLQVLYEDDYPEWTVIGALKELTEEGHLERWSKNQIPELAGTESISEMNFYANSRAVRTERERRRMKTHMASQVKLLEKYTGEIIDALGRQLESLVKNQLLISQFDILGTNANEYDGRKWTESDHNMDIIARKKGGDLVVGVEVKNSMGIMDLAEIDPKIELCRYLGIVPVFATRWNRPREDHIREHGGFSWTFKVQIFPFGQEKLVEELHDRLSVGKADGPGMRMEFPVAVRNDLPEQAVREFDDWAKRME